MNKLLKTSFNIFHKADPTNEALVNAVKFTVPCIVGAICWSFFNRPFTFFISFVPAVSFFTIIPYSTYKDKFLSLTSFLLFMAILQMIIAVFYSHHIIMMILLFIAIFLAVANTKYKYSIIFAVLWAVIYMVFPQGANNGIIRTIEIVCIAAIVVILIFIYEYFFSILILRSSIVYLTEIITDAIDLVTAPEKERTEINLMKKYIFNSPISFRPEAAVEKIYLEKTDKIEHRMLIKMINKGKIINKEEFYFRKNIQYRTFISPIYIRLRRLFRDSTFLLKYRSCKNDIENILPSTSLLINDINKVLNGIIIALKSEKSTIPSLKTINIEKWKNEYALFIKSNKDKADDDTLEALFGLNCIIIDTEIICSLLSNRP